MDFDIQELLRRASEPTMAVNSEQLTNDNDALYETSAPATEFSAELPISEFLSEEQKEEEARKYNVRQETLRFSGAEWFSKVQEKVIVVVGVGGIGSWLSLLLGKLQPSALYLFDPDTVESVNMAGQLYGRNSLGNHKVTALENTIRDFSGYDRTNTLAQRFDESFTNDIIMTGLDNMEGRKYCYLSWKRHVINKRSDEDRKKCLFIDGRLTANQLQVLCFTGLDTYYMQQYEERFLFDDDEAEHLACSFKQTAFMANMIASIMVNLFVNFCSNECDTNMMKPLPFFTEYYSDFMLLNQEK